MDQVEYDSRLRFLIPVTITDSLFNRHQFDTVYTGSDKKHKKTEKEYVTNSLYRLNQQIRDDLKAIYWYSFFFNNTFYCDLHFVEKQCYLFDSETFRNKYIKLAKLEYLYQIFQWLENHMDNIYGLGMSLSAIKPIENFIIKQLKLNICSMYLNDYFLYTYEEQRKARIFSRLSSYQKKKDERKKTNSLLFLLVFHKGREAKMLNEDIHRYIYDFVNER